MTPHSPRPLLARIASATRSRLQAVVKFFAAEPTRRKRNLKLTAVLLMALGVLSTLLPAAYLLAESRFQADAASSSAVLPQVPVQQESPSAEPTPASHTVQPGETLSEIAKQYGFSVEQLLRVNGITNANTIYVGQRLRLPASDRPPGAIIHVIVAGDTLSTIAKQYGVSLDALMQRNGMSDPNDITSGLELVIPDGSAEAEPTAPEVASTPAPLTSAPTLAQDEATVPAPPLPADTAAIATIAPVVILPAAVTGAPTAEPVQIFPGQSAPAVGQTAIEPDLEAQSVEAAPTEAPTLEAESHTHTVRPGETASEIAKRYGVTLTDLLRTNGIANADLLRSGAELIIPGKALDAVVATAEASVLEPSATAVPMSMTADEIASDTGAENTDGELSASAEIAHSISGAVPLPERPASSLNRSYTVVSGDTLGRIASRQAVDLEGLRILNGLARDAALRAGDSLLLPATDDELLVRTPENFVVVKPGDSLSAIAVANGVDLGALMAANGIRNADSIRAGQELIVPGRPIYGDAPLTRVGPARSGYYYHVVQAGDTLSELADNLGTTKTAVMDYNNLTDESTIFSGMELRIPYGAPQLPKRTPPVPISGTSFLISLSRQQCWVLTGTEVRHAWNCSTGRADRRTKTGSFKVQSKIANAESNVWRLDMPFWLGIYDVGRVENGIHGLPVDWDTGNKIWTRLIGQPATFGCAMLDDTNAETLWNAAYLGMPVTIVQ